MMTTYTRRGTGQQYLKLVLGPLVCGCGVMCVTYSPKIQDLGAKFKNPLEVDPIKVVLLVPVLHHRCQVYHETMKLEGDISNAEQLTAEQVMAIERVCGVFVTRLLSCAVCTHPGRATDAA